MKLLLKAQLEPFTLEEEIRLSLAADEIEIQDQSLNSIGIAFNKLKQRSNVKFYGLSLKDSLYRETSARSLFIRDLLRKIVEKSSCIEQINTNVIRSKYFLLNLVELNDNIDFLIRRAELWDKHLQNN